MNFSSIATQILHRFRLLYIPEYAKDEIWDRVNSNFYILKHWSPWPLKNYLERNQWYQYTSLPVVINDMLHFHGLQVKQGQNKWCHCSVRHDTSYYCLQKQLIFQLSVPNTYKLLWSLFQITLFYYGKTTAMFLRKVVFPNTVLTLYIRWFSILLRL